MKEKLKRFLTSLLPVAENRRGDCNRCGACCKLPFPCPFLRFDGEGLSTCAVYFARPPSCRKYPRTQDEQLTPETCGYFFVSAEQMRDQLRGTKGQPAHDAPTPAGAAAYDQQ